MVAKRVIYEGRVQGVGFRYTVKDLARGFEVTGWVRNLPDGSVELQAMGEKDELAAFLHEIREESAVAGNIKTHYVSDIPPLDGVTGFSIVR
ncbi:MAG: acylphosphatase [Akkermansiaceae bacterium]|nr:acylphosphatase [Akkermansiaceae bacterium]MCP5542635.1 acylphosphatase [Akkermansiaceae bacterium]MCP5548252.1 acylphosphatase [Akkermansiaceae bacterium]